SIPCVEWIRGVVAKIIGAVKRAERGLVLATALQIGTGLDRVPVPNLGQAVRYVNRSVVIDEWRVARPKRRTRCHPTAVECDVGKVIPLYCTLVQQRESHSRRRPCISVRRLVDQNAVVAQPNIELVRYGRAKDVSVADSPPITGVCVLNRRQRRI